MTDNLSDDIPASRLLALERIVEMRLLPLISGLKRNHAFMLLSTWALVFSYMCPLVSYRTEAVTLSFPTILSNTISFSFDSPTNQLLIVQSSTSLGSQWMDSAQYPGTGARLTFSAPLTSEPRLFRVKSIKTATSLELTPDAPTLTTGDISLPDAVVGEAYLEQISPGSSGVAPYSMQITGSAPDGVTVAVRSNETAHASVQIISSGATLVSGQRRPFTITVTDSSKAIVARQYDLRVIAAPPRIMLEPLTLKAGEPVNAKLKASGGTEPLSWSVIEGLPAGLSLSSDGILSGTPTVDASELNENGRYANSIQVADSFTDRLTGAPLARKSTNTLETLVRLSYLLNIQASRNEGPSLYQSCFICHSENFKPNLQGNARDLINVLSGSGAECDTDRVYVAPRDASDSLIYQKVAERNPCGERMPFAGPYFSDLQIERLARWIRELNEDDAD